MSRDWETPRVQRLSFIRTEGGTSTFTYEDSLYKTGS